MKEKDIKKAYEKIELSDNEKNMIFNRIMDNRKKSINWKPYFGFGLVAIASLVMAVFLGNNDIIIKNKENDNINNAESTMGRNVSLENEYKKEIIIGARKFLEANKIDINNIEEGNQLVIKGEDIIDNNNYKSCTGNLIIKRYNDDFSYSTEVKCDGKDKDLSNGKEFIIYSGTLTDVFELKYGIAVASISNVKKPNFDVLDCDAKLIVMDNEGNIKFNKMIESKYTDEDSTVKVINVQQINNKYYIILEVANEIHFEASGSGSLRNHYYLMVLDENGKELKYNELFDKDGNVLTLDNYIGGDNQAVYYTGLVYYKNNQAFSNVVIKISDDYVETVVYQELDDKTEGISTHNVVKGYNEDGFYGYSYDKSYDSGTYYSAKKLFKINKKGQVVWDRKLDNNIYKVLVDNKIYALVHDGENSFIYIIGLDGQEDGNSLLKDFNNIDDLYLEGSNIIIKGSDKDGNYFFEVYNDKLKRQARINIDNTDIEDNFDYSFMQSVRLIDGKIVAGYTVNKDFTSNEEVLLVFNK